MDNINPAISVPPSSDPPVRRCFSCQCFIDTFNYLSWDFLDFCNEFCIISCVVNKTCMHCVKAVAKENHGKYILQAASKFYQFCDEGCLKKYQAVTNFCIYCEKSSLKRLSKRWIKTQFDVNGKEVSASFCSSDCVDNFNSVVRGKKLGKQSPKATCLVCDTNNARNIIYFNNVAHYFCSLDCGRSFTTIQIGKDAGECLMCKNYFSKDRLVTLFYQNVKQRFCSNNCKNIYKNMSKVAMNCSFCLNASDNYSMIKRYSNVESDQHFFCSMNCLILANTAESLPMINVHDDEAYKSVVKKTLVIVAMTKPNKNQRNVVTSCNTRLLSKGNNTDNHVNHADATCQADFPLNIIPIPIPIFIPIPSHTYNIPQPVPTPFPLPIPIPIFLPITQRSMDVLKELSCASSRGVITDPLQAEMLQIADVLTEDDQIDATRENTEVTIWQPGVDFESELPDNVTEIRNYVPLQGVERRGRKRQDVLAAAYTSEPKRRSYLHYNPATGVNEEVNVIPLTDIQLDYNVGLNAWKQWATTMNYSNRNPELQIDILQMCPEDLNYALCLFVRSARRPNGEMYSPDTIFYICLGIQYYLNCNGRTENLFFDGIFEMFTTCLDEQARKYSQSVLNDSHYLVTRVEEEHLWETKQLGGHSPWVLLNTIIYFNTKYYHRATVKEHMDVSFFHMQRFYKKNNKTENFNSRYYNIQGSYDDENETVSKCPTALYKQYVSKCPENVKNGLTTFYLVPEKHSSLDSPVWYTAQPLSEEIVSVMLNRIKMVKEIMLAFYNRSRI